MMQIMVLGGPVTTPHKLLTPWLIVQVKALPLMPRVAPININVPIHYASVYLHLYLVYQCISTIMVDGALDVTPLLHVGSFHAQAAFGLFVGMVLQKMCGVW
jgi:hypothetical protein